MSQELKVDDSAEVLAHDQGHEMNKVAPEEHSIKSEIAKVEREMVKFVTGADQVDIPAPKEASKTESDVSEHGNSEEQKGFLCTLFGSHCTNKCASGVSGNELTFKTPVEALTGHPWEQRSQEA